MADPSIRLSEHEKVLSPGVSLSGLSQPGHTDPPGKYILLYDGFCRFCTAQSQNLVALARRGTVEAVNFQIPGALDPFPGISHKACMQAMHLVTPDGRIYKGFEAAVRALATRPILGWLAYAYYLPGCRQMIDWLYVFIARRRYWLFGHSGSPQRQQGSPNSQECPTGTCKLHRP